MLVLSAPAAVLILQFTSISRWGVIDRRPIATFFLFVLCACRRERRFSVMFGSDPNCAASGMILLLEEPPVLHSPVRVCVHVLKRCRVHGRLLIVTHH